MQLITVDVKKSTFDIAAVEGASNSIQMQFINTPDNWREDTVGIYALFAKGEKGEVYPVDKETMTSDVPNSMVAENSGFKVVVYAMNSDTENPYRDVLTPVWVEVQDGYECIASAAPDKDNMDAISTLIQVLMGYDEAESTREANEEKRESAIQEILDDYNSKNIPVKDLGKVSDASFADEIKDFGVYRFNIYSEGNLDDSITYTNDMEGFLIVATESEYHSDKEGRAGVALYQVMLLPNCFRTRWTMHMNTDDETPSWDGWINIDSLSFKVDELENHFLNFKTEMSGNLEAVEDRMEIKVNDAVYNLINSAPETLNTLSELAAALGDDPNFATTIMDMLGNKVDKKLYDMDMDWRNQRFAELDDEIYYHKVNAENPHRVTKQQIGLENVDNTADMDKPISNAVQKALDTLIESKLWLSSGNSTAGIMGYYFSDIDFNTKQITLTKVQGEAPAEAFNVKYSVGDIVSLNNGSKFPNCSKITAIDKNIITVDSLPFDSMIEDDEPSSDEWNFYVIEKPDAGEIRLGEFAVALGELCLALERSTIAGGRECLCYSPYGVSLGRENKSGYAAFAVCMLTEALGQWSSAINYKTKALGDAAHAQNRATIASGDDSDAGGFQTEARKKATFTRGYGTIADSLYQAVLGKFNIIDSNNIFAAIIGNGTSNSKRSNAFTLDWLGNGWFGGDVTVGTNNEKLATEAVVDTKIASFATTIANQLGLKANSADLTTVATSGSYDDLKNKPLVINDLGSFEDKALLEEALDKCFEDGIYYFRTRGVFGRLNNVSGFLIVVNNTLESDASNTPCQIMIRGDIAYPKKRTSYYDWDTRKTKWNEWTDYLSSYVTTDSLNTALEEAIHPSPITTIPTTLEPNKQYNLGEVTELSLVFPTVANAGDVVYLTFYSGATAATLSIDTTNTCDIEVVPEANTGYEIFGKYNGSIWIVNYSEYTVSEG